MKRRLPIITCLLALTVSAPAAGLKSFELTPDWQSKIQQTALLQFILGGIQYTLGDLERPDSPQPCNH